MSTLNAQIPSAATPFLNPDGSVHRAWYNFFFALQQGVADAYTPTLTIVANLDAVAAYSCLYLRVGSHVLVAGKFDANPTAAAATTLGISLPITSAFTAATDCSGVVTCPTVAGQSAAIYADTTNDRAQVEWLAVNTSVQAMHFFFLYKLI